MRRAFKLFLVLVIGLLPLTGLEAKSYSSGSRSSSSSPSRSSSFSSSSASSSSRSYGSGARTSYTSPSSSSTYAPARSYSSSAKSYAPTPSRTYSSGSVKESVTTHTTTPAATRSSSYSFDSSAAAASRRVTSQREYESAHQAKAPDPAPAASARTARQPGSSSATTGVPAARTVSRPTIILSDESYRTRPVRYERTYAPYRSRPVVIYNDPIDSLFWYWLLDQSVESRASWAYHHRASIDAARYQSLLNNDRAVADRVAALEREAVRRDSNFAPQGMEPDLMYTGTHVDDAYASRPTWAGRVMFWVFMTPLALLAGAGLVWFVFYKRW